MICDELPFFNSNHGVALDIVDVMMKLVSAGSFRLVIGHLIEAKSGLAGLGDSTVQLWQRIQQDHLYSACRFPRISRIEDCFQLRMRPPHAIDHRFGPVEILVLSFLIPVSRRSGGNVPQVAYLVGQFDELCLWRYVSV